MWGDIGMVNQLARGYEPLAADDLHRCVEHGAMPSKALS
jgi:hypothetical protein